MQNSKRPDKHEFVECQAWNDAIDGFARTRPRSRRKKVSTTLLCFARGSKQHPDIAVNKHPDRVTREDLEAFFEKICKYYLDWTVHDYKLILKLFYSKRKGKRFVSWIKIPRNIRSRLGPEDLITREELQRLVSRAETARDKAVITTLLESGFRPHEFLSLKIKSVTFDDRGSTLHIDSGKTGPRTVRLIESTPHLALWLSSHPLRENREAPLWINQSTNSKNEALKQVGLNRLVKKLSSEAHIEKRVFAYLFRHTRNTELAKILTESQLKTYAGWTGDSRMPATYVHLSGRDIEPSLLAAYGVSKRREDEMKDRVPKKCDRCGESCAYDEEICHRCGMALTVKASMKLNEASELSLVKRFEELDRFVRTSLIRNSLENTILAAVANGKIVPSIPIDASQLTEGENIALQEYMTLYAVPRKLN